MNNPALAAIVANVEGTDAITPLIKPRKNKLVQRVGDLYDFKLNDIRGQIELDGKPISGNFLKTFYLDLAENNNFDISPENAANVVLKLADRNRYNPVEDYLNECNNPLPKEVWDNIALYIFGNKAPADSINFRRQIIAAVARIYKQPSKVDTALILQSDTQGEGKEAVWENLGGEWYNASLGSLGNQSNNNTLITLHSAWFHNWGEIDRIMGMQSSENIKHFMSIQSDNFRLPHEKSNVIRHRKSVLVGTTNKRNFIKDPTGNRRFPIISSNRINYDWVKQHRDQIFASAKIDFLEGVRWWYDKEEIIELNNQAMGFAAPDPLLDEMEEVLDISNYPREDVCIKVVIAKLNPELNQNELKIKERDNRYTKQIATRLQQLGWIKGNRARFKMDDLTTTEKTTIYKRVPQTATTTATF